MERVVEYRYGMVCGWETSSLLNGIGVTLIFRVFKTFLQFLHVLVFYCCCGKLPQMSVFNTNVLSSSSAGQKS